MGNERDRQNKAVLAFRQALKLNPRNGEGWNSLGATYQTLNNYDEAFRCYKQAEALGNPYAAQNYANLKSALAAAARASTNFGDNPSNAGGNPCSSYSGPSHPPAIKAITARWAATKTINRPKRTGGSMASNDLGSKIRSRTLCLS